jgi:Cu2+-exporting ATPase
MLPDVPDVANIQPSSEVPDIANLPDIPHPSAKLDIRDNPELTGAHYSTEMPGLELADQQAWKRALAQHHCVHCGSELGRAWREKDGPFCCRGCRAVYGLIHQAGLQRYYDLRQGRHSPPAVLRPDTFAWLDRILDQETSACVDKNGQNTRIVQLTLDIQGVHCAACVWLLEELYRRMPGGLDLRINPSLGKVDLTWDLARGNLKDYLSEVEAFGYRFGPSRKQAPTRSRDLLVRLAICVAIALNVMMFSVSFYLGLAASGGALYTFFGQVSLVLATISVMVGGPVFLKGAMAGLRRRMAHLDLPISLGMILAYLGSVYGYFTIGPDAAYFDSLTIFVALMLVGRWAQEHILERNRNALLACTGAENFTAKRRQGSHLVAISAPEIERGDELWIAPGDLVPVAGILLRRAASVSLDWITGESDPFAYQVGDSLPAGAFNAGQIGFTITATEDFSESRLQELLRAGPGAAGSRASTHPRWWSRISSIYVLAVLALATTGFLIWMSRDTHRALEVTVAILVVTCPCALGLAVPLARELIHFALRRRGVFLRTATFLEKALAVRKILLDKTGTLTLGRLVLTTESGQALGLLSSTHRTLLRNMTARSNHPVSRALLAALGKDGEQPAAPAGAAKPLPAGSDQPAVTVATAAKPSLPPAGFDPSLEEVSEHPGQGLAWSQGGRCYRLGRQEFALAAETRASGNQSACSSSADRATYFSVDGQVLAAFRFAEEFKADASDEVNRLQQAGCEVFLLSGDDQSKVTAAAVTLGIPPSHAVGSLTPEAKAEQVAQLDRADTLMVGDGLNDSLSFAAAFCCATPAVDRPVLPGKADFYFLGDGIAAIGRALVAARRLRQVVRDNLILAGVYNLAAVGLCLAGWVTPVVAAILMPLSSVAVVSLTAFRLSGRRLKWLS